MLTAWCLVIGLLLIGMGLTDTMRRDLPFSASALYLLAGWLIGPQVGGLLHLDLFGDARLLEVLTEAAVLISLFAVGMRLRVRLTDRLSVEVSGGLFSGAGPDTLGRFTDRDFVYVKVKRHF